MALEMVLGSKFLSLRPAAAAASVAVAESFLPVAMGPSVCAATSEGMSSIVESRPIAPATMTICLCRISVFSPNTRCFSGDRTRRYRLPTDAATYLLNVFDGLLRGIHLVVEVEHVLLRHRHLG